MKFLLKVADKLIEEGNRFGRAIELMFIRKCLPVSLTGKIVYSTRIGRLVIGASRAHNAPKSDAIYSSTARDVDIKDEIQRAIARREGKIVWDNKLWDDIATAAVARRLTVNQLDYLFDECENGMSPSYFPLHSLPEAIKTGLIPEQIVKLFKIIAKRLKIGEVCPEEGFKLFPVLVERAREALTIMGGKNAPLVIDIAQALLCVNNVALTLINSSIGTTRDDEKGSGALPQIVDNERVIYIIDTFLKGFGKDTREYAETMVGITTLPIILRAGLSLDQILTFYKSLPRNIHHEDGFEVEEGHHIMPACICHYNGVLASDNFRLALTRAGNIMPPGSILDLFVNLANGIDPSEKDEIDKKFGLLDAVLSRYTTPLNHDQIKELYILI